MLEIGSRIEVMLMMNGYEEPFHGWRNEWIPLEIVEEYPMFYVCDVLPHVNPINKRQGFKTLSKPYRTTIHKLDIGEKWKVREMKEHG